ncbi:MAG: hypothetical protein KBA95_13245 [Acidobacteria bacterium]|nr:hypothetical protein [Acidobacteriota bacterium]
MTRWRREEVRPWELEYLLTGDTSDGWGWIDLEGDRDRGGGRVRGLWERLRAELLASWTREHPGTRPAAWWWFDAPRWRRADWPRECQCLGPWADERWAEPRRRLGGIGDPAFLKLAIVPSFERGIPRQWVDAWDVAYYTGQARDVHGEPIGSEFAGREFTGAAVDPSDPPTFESEAAYLERHGLLTHGERARLTLEDFTRPVRVAA